MVQALSRQGLGRQRRQCLQRRQRLYARLGAGLRFPAFGENFSLSNWHEQTFDRDDEYLKQNYVNGPAGSTGTNGAVALWWHPIDEITTGVQYRYSNNKLGTADHYQNAMIYTLKYNFL